MNADTIIVGSGFGGSFAADRLVAAGQRVLMVERGPWRDTAPIRAAGIACRSPLPHGRQAHKLVRRIVAPGLPADGLRLSSEGLLDVHLGRDLTVVASSGVGGGSHVYTAMNCGPASPTYWSAQASLDDSAMTLRVQAAIDRMGARQVRPGDGVPNALVHSHATGDVLRTPAELEQPPMSVRTDTGTLASNSYFGSADGSKVTLDALLLAPALSRGLEIADRSQAVEFGRTAGGWRVTLRCERSGRFRHVNAPRLLLAAGTLNTLPLLFQARASGVLGSLPALGHGISGNGDVLAHWACNAPGEDFSIGAPCHGRFAVDDEGDDLFLGSFGFNGIDELPLPRRLRDRLKRDLLLVGMGADDATGLATWSGGRLRLNYSATASPVLRRVREAFGEVERRSGRRVRFPAGPTITVHLVGGARTSSDPQRGVVDSTGQVHGQPGLHVLDASALPAAPGRPPSMTIAAWASHVADHLER